MRLINLDENNAGDGVERAPRYTFCVYGPTGSGKTTYAGSFPRPVFLSEVTESGYESLRGISDDALFEPGIKPIVLGIEKMNDMAMAREVLTPHIASGMVQTVVIDSLTFYADLYLNYLFALYSANKGDNLKAYGDLGKHLRDLRVKWHQMGCNVVSLCLPQDPDEGSANALPAIAGKEGKTGKFAASCDFLLYLRHDRFKQGSNYIDSFEVHSKPYGNALARARRAIGQPELPTPLVNTCYADTIARLGFDVDATRAALPEYKDPSAALEAAINGFARAAATTTPPAMAVTVAAPAAPHVPTAAAPRHVPNAARPVNGRPPQPTVIRRPAVPVRSTGNNS